MSNRQQKSTFQKITKFVVYVMLFVTLAGIIIGALMNFQ